MAFFLCASCQRHVRASDDACPFCGASTTGAKVAGNPRTNVRDRNKLLFGAAIAAVAGAASAIGCSGSTTAPGPEEDSGLSSKDAGPDVSVAPLYGAMQVDSGSDSGGATPAYGGAPLYGAPAYDSGK